MLQWKQILWNGYLDLKLNYENLGEDALTGFNKVWYISWLYYFV